METAIVNIDEELQHYILQMSLSQKKSILEMIKSFVLNEEKKPINIEEHNNKLEEAEAEYGTGKTTVPETELDEINSWIGKPQTIEEYNKELEEAVAEVKNGKYYTQKEIKEMAKNW